MFFEYCLSIIDVIKTILNRPSLSYGYGEYNRMVSVTRFYKPHRVKIALFAQVTTGFHKNITTTFSLDTRNIKKNFFLQKCRIA